MAESLEERIKRLEDVAFEGDGLTRAVERLGLNANALGEALLQVDKQQQMLTKLGVEITEVRGASVSKDDLADHDRRRRTDTLDFRKRLLTRVYTVAIALILIIVAVLAGLQDRADKQKAARLVLCEQSARAARIVQRFTMEQIAIERQDRLLDNALRAKKIESLQTLGSAFPIPDCTKGSAK